MAPRLSPRKKVIVYFVEHLYQKSLDDFIKDIKDMWVTESVEVRDHFPNKDFCMCDIQGSSNCDIHRETIRIAGPGEGEAVVWAKPTLPGKHCNWSSDDEGTWTTACEGAWQFEDGGPEDNQAKYCPFCGRLIEVVMETDG